MEKKKNQPPKQMYGILNRATERPQMDWKTLHMWFVNRIYTLHPLSSLLLAAPVWGARGGVTQCPVQAAVSPGHVSSTPELPVSGCSWLQWLFWCSSPTVLSRQRQRKGWWREGWVWFTVSALEKERNRWMFIFPCCLYWIYDDIQEICETFTSLINCWYVTIQPFFVSVTVYLFI